MSDFSFQRKTSAQHEEEDGVDDEAYMREREVRVEQTNNDLFTVYGDDYDDYNQKRRRKLFSVVSAETNNTLVNVSDKRPHSQDVQKWQGKALVSQHLEEPGKVANPLQTVQASTPHVQQNKTELKQAAPVRKVEQIKKKQKVWPAKSKKVKSNQKPEQKNSLVLVNKEQFKTNQQPASLKDQEILGSNKRNNIQIQKDQHQNNGNETLLRKKTMAADWFKKGEESSHPAITRRISNRFIRKTSETDSKMALRNKEIEKNMPLQKGLNKPIYKVTAERKRWSDVRGERGRVGEEKGANGADNKTDSTVRERNSMWKQRGKFNEGTDYEEDSTPPPVFDKQVNWNQTFQVNHLDLQAQRSDQIDLSCNVSGNLLLHPSDALPIVNAFMDQLNEQHKGYAVYFHPLVCGNNDNKGFFFLYYVFLQ